MLPKLFVATVATLMMPGMFAPGRAADVETTSCLGSHDVSSCTTVWRRADDSFVRIVSAPATALDSEAVERDRQWVARCHPVIKQDRYGVGRYHYAAPGCEFGVIGTDITP
jgi:hypothetical protein